MHPRQDPHPDDSDEQDLPERPSKSQKKRDAHALQALGKELVALSAEQLKRIDMPDNLRIAIAEAQRTRSHEGLRRQMQYVGKVMRGVDTGPDSRATMRDCPRAVAGSATMGNPPGLMAAASAAEKGDAIAQAKLGDMYYNGEGVQKDYAEAARWYKKAAEQGDVIAQGQYDLIPSQYK